MTNFNYPPSKSLLRRAAALLSYEAKTISSSCEGVAQAPFVCGDCHRGSDGRCKAQQRHDELKKTAEALRKAAR